MSIKKNLVMECECCGLTKPVKMFNLDECVCNDCAKPQKKINDLRFEGRALSDLLMNVLKYHYIHSKIPIRNCPFGMKQNVYKFPIIENIACDDKNFIGFEIVDYWDYKVSVIGNILSFSVGTGVMFEFKKIMILLDDKQKELVFKYVGF